MMTLDMARQGEEQGRFVPRQESGSKQQSHLLMKSPRPYEKIPSLPSKVS